MRLTSDFFNNLGYKAKFGGPGQVVRLPGRRRRSPASGSHRT